MPIVLIAAVAAQLALPACMPNGHPGQWVREGAAYISPDDSQRRIAFRKVAQREYMLVAAGEDGLLLRFGTSELGLLQQIAVGPGELAAFACVASGEA